MGATKSWTRSEVAARILQGDSLLIYDNHLIRVPQSWLKAHPGGDLAILHFLGRDGTDEIQAFHCDETIKRIQKYSIGRVEQNWEPLVPPIMTGWVRREGENGQQEWYNEAKPVISAVNTELSPSSQILLVERNTLQAPTLPNLDAPPCSLSLKVQAEHSAAYKVLHKRVRDAGLYQCRYLTGYGPEVLRYLLLASISAYAYSQNWLITSAVFLGLFWHQLTFTVHDLGHMGVTHNWTLDRLIAIFLADFLGGLSVGWWVDNHNVHHLVTNHPTHDPDIQHLPFFAISPVFIGSLWSSYYKRVMHFDRVAKFFIAIQHKMFYIVMAFARFNLYALSYGFLFRKAFDTRRAKGHGWSWALEVLGLAFYWTWFGAVLRGCGSWKMMIAYLVVSHAVTSPLHVQIVLSHFSMSTADLGPTESFPHRQLRTTTDVICPPELSFIHGGLHLQVTHHLFPRLPRHNLRAASALVKEFAKERGLVYAEFGFREGNGEVIGVLRGVAEQVAIVGRVADAEVQEKLLNGVRTQ
ncbi:hypothetical protein HWV62_39421 [Athelia sp. TMB]|nr:hypothetical protein HWV62_39421 [Athelia sp. TMB]